MTRKAKLWLAAAGIFLLFLVAALVIGAALRLRGSDVWTLRLGLALLGLAAAIIVLWFFGDRGVPASTGALRNADLDGAMAAARAQLASAKTAGKGSLAQLPLVLVMGAPASAKTTSVVRSGLEPELLAGAVSQGDVVAPTGAGVNVWYAHGTIFLEAGGGLIADPVRFARLIQHARPRRLAAALGGGGQATRVAVVCVSCDEFLRPGASESSITLARTLRTRLSDVARGLGIRLPVYVVFTKADRIPYFTDYVQNFSTDDVRQVLGATLPAATGATGLYADRETRRLTEAFQALFRSLANKRLQFLEREHAPERKPGAYEFPRELRKLASVAVPFLVELGKPSQLQVSPFVRGFYFAGVRPVIISDAAPGIAAPTPARAAAGLAATGVFGAAEQMSALSTAPAAPATRKVPQWVFYSRLFTDVILGDRAAQAATHGGTRVNLLRRVLLGGALAAAVALMAALGISDVGNRTLQRNTIDAARAMAALPAVGSDIPPLPVLMRLDSLRAQLQVLSAYERQGPPLHLRFGLYTGSALYPEARRVYFASFDKVMFGATRDAMATTLRTLPAAPRASDDYGTTYNLLKAYLITTAEPARSTEDFLVPVLMTEWLGARPLDSARTQLARQQFAFYANELRFANPYPQQPDVGTIAHARGFLNQFAGAERIYQFMLAEAGKGNPPIEFNRHYPGSAAYVVDSYTVPGAFTKGGYAAMQNAFKNADRFFQGERWVLGDEPVTQVDRTKMLADLRARYQADYLKHWRAYLQSAAVVRYTSVKDAARKLAALSGNQSPLLAMLSLASQNATVDSQTISAGLQPAEVVTPPGMTDRFIGPSNSAYMTALASLQASLDQVAAAPAGGADAAIGQATANASAAKLEAQKIAQQFRVAGDAVVGATVLRLLQDPITDVEPFLRNFGVGELNARGAAFCARVAPLLSLYPFDPSATTQANPADVAAIFRPGTGALWTFYSEALQNILVQQGNTYAPKPGATPVPSAAFIAFFDRAAALSDALFRDGATDPHLAFTLKPALSQVLSNLAVDIDRQTVQFSDKRVTAHAFAWTASPSGEAAISGRLGKTELKVLGYQGPWAVFQMFDQADRWQTLGGVPTVEWTVRTGGQPMTLSNGTPVKVAFEVDMGTVPPVLRKGYFSGFRCVAQVVK